ncbi:hypothetical protein [Halosegnis marinus]|uniref:Uncharacterized protein n=1 Tax=Halosegnis marinus TaxID=3034023 RepID=A0ABD5ZP86_9EURY|nr:hypothetical protein [Halosegnis sp. DT85]
MTPPTTCPRCGAPDSYERRYTTGGGWRQVHVCAVCGHRAVGPAGRRVAVGAVAAAAVLALARAVRRRL